jgi:hypothetical protein
MLKENEFMIDGYKNFKARASFVIITWEDQFEHDVEISCAEDFEEVMRLYFKKEWKTLFYDWNEMQSNWWKDVCDVGFEGIYITAKEESKGHLYYRLNTNQRVTVTVNLETMGDKNAEKINEIRAILNKQ